MLEKLPDVLGHALRHVRAGLEQIAITVAAIGSDRAGLEPSATNAIDSIARYARFICASELKRLKKFFPAGFVAATHSPQPGDRPRLRK